MAFDVVTAQWARKKANEYTDAAVQGLAGGVKYKGSIAFDDLPAPSEDNKGWMYTVSDKFNHQFLSDGTTWLDTSDDPAAYPFGSWITTDTTINFCESVLADESVRSGASYYGELRCTDLPNSILVADVFVNVVEVESQKRLILTLYSTSAPYFSSYVYYSGVTDPEWKSSPIRTSELINDGGDGESTYITTQEVEEKIRQIKIEDLQQDLTIQLYGGSATEVMLNGG